MESGVSVNITRFTPEIGLRGTYTLLAPYNEAIGIAIYTCQAIQSISSLKAQGIDVYATYYEPFGVELESFETDEERDASIITLLSDSGTQHFFPVGYLESYPNMNGIPYRATHFYVHLPPSPLDYDFTLLKDALEQTVKSYLGVPEALARPIVASETSLVPEADSDVLMADRNTNKEASSPMVLAELWRTRYETLKREHDQLLTYMQNNR